jgi:hypothetical protein
MDKPQKVTNLHQGQVLYLGKWVDKSSFGAFVYNDKDEQKLANNYAEYESLIASGIWFATKPDPSLKKEKKKDAVRADA